MRTRDERDVSALPYRNPAVAVTGPRGKVEALCLVSGCGWSKGRITRVLAANAAQEHRQAHRDAYWRQHVAFGLGQTESQWQAKVVDYARRRGWTDFHHRVSKGTRHGWPDLALVRRERLVLAELKRQDGCLSGPQTQVLKALAQTPAEVHVWRPADWPLVEQVLL